MVKFHLVAVVLLIAQAGAAIDEPQTAPAEVLSGLGPASLDVAPANVSESTDMTLGAMEAAITDLMHGKSAFGATPMGGSVKKIKDLLTKTMMPKVLAAHKADQNELNRLVKEIAKCGKTKDSALKGAKVSFNKYKKESRYHKSCRGDEAVKYTSKKNCLTQQKSLYNIKVLKCKAFGSISKKWGTTKNNQAVVNKGASESAESYVTRLSVTFCGRHVHGPKGTKKTTGGWGGGLAGGMLGQYLRAKEACQRATRNYNNKVKECKRKIHAYNVRKAKCNQYQTLMDTHSCKQAVLTKDACESYSGCYYSKLKAYRIVEAKVRLEERDRKAEWRGLKRMDCLIDAFADGKVTNAEVDACKKKTVSTSLLNIKYPKVPPLVKCTVSQLYPSTGTYKKTEFAPLPLLAKGKESAECSGVAEISLKAASGSPTSCKCSRVTLNGPYSAGPMVKCTNCRSVRTANQKNSCPRGTKLFSPASRSDWQTFFSSAGSLYAPHWIIDVTRPQNGCGGCTRYPMNSGNTKQKSWRTSDGSPWWLRSTRYSEPNGDYNANCFLNLWHNPRRATAVTFNDGRCNYHSKSYYCQLKDMDLMPKSGSPKSCKCRLVSLSGRYSAGRLVKCEQCLTVYKSNQKNSCPKGMKIFAPRSRQDWKTFIASAGPLRAPHWIIDVTRPQNGCGGCTRYSMKSTTPQQATWRTSDRAPWWLRNSRYNEPNGDYTANCFLDLWRKPSSENSVTFNDGRCNYRSRSYYCQTIKTKPKPRPAPPPSKMKGFKVGLTWIQSAKGDTCVNACKKVKASCAEHKFPKSIGVFKDILKKMNHKSCKSIHTGSWQYNPTQAPSNTCYWRGRGSNRCRGKYGTERRFCPCQLATWSRKGKASKKEPCRAKFSGVCGQQWAFVTNKKNDLIAIKMGPRTGSGKTEVHRLTARSNYKKFDLHVATAIGYTNHKNWAFVMDSKDDLLGILKGPRTGSGKTEVHRLSAKSNYKKFNLQTGTGMGYSMKNWAFTIDSKNNLVGVLKGPKTGSKKTEVHRLSASSNYRKFNLHTATSLAYSDDSSGTEWDFLMDPRDNLVCIKKGPVTGSGKTEVHKLSSSSNFKKFTLHTATALSYTNGLNWAFAMAKNDLVGVLKGTSTGTCMTEVHKLRGNTYKRFNLQVGTGLALTGPTSCK